jgi:putative ABC transport system permease protein
MQAIVLLSFRNLFRNRRRTLITLTVVAGGVAALVLAGGFFSYMFWGLRETTIRNGLGHLQVFNAALLEREDEHVLENGLEDPQRIAAQIERVSHVRGVAPRIEFYGLVSNGRKSTTFMATAVDPAAEKRMGFQPNISPGRWFEEGSSSRPDEALLGAGLAHSMNAKPGDGLTLLAATADGALNGIDIEVAGIVNTGIKEMDERVLQITIPTAQRLLQSARVTKLVVGLDRTENTDRVLKALVSLAPAAGQRIGIRTWYELATFYRQVRLLFSGIFVFLGVIVFFMVVMSSANTLLMSMFERTREIGTMLAMGTPRSCVLLLFLSEGLLTGLLGACGGAVLGTVSGVLLNHAAIQLPPPPGNTTGWTFQVLFEPGLIFGSAALVVVVLACTSVIPAVRASRINIVESLASI